MNPRYSVIHISELIIYYHNIREIEITNIRLQKLLYFVQAYFLVERGCCCFSGNISAWRYGPVVYSAYRIYRFFGTKNIKLNNYDMVFEIEAQDFNDIVMIVDSYREMPVWQIVEKSCIPGSPPEIAYRENKDIELGVMLHYFLSRRADILGG